MEWIEEIQIKNERDKNLYMQGYEQACKDINNQDVFTKGYMYGIEVENGNLVRNLEEYLYELETKRKNGEIVIGYWQIRTLVKELIQQCKIN